MSKIIQFMHPGQYTCNKGQINWNRKDHKRKLIKNEMSYIKDGVVCKNTNGYFWGEWEPESNCVKESGYYVHTVNYPSDTVHNPSDGCKGGCKKTGDYLNTDPYVFGDYFIYSNCLQLTYTALQNLKKDDIILFGSRSDGKFILDTLFVVDRELQPNEIVSDCFKKATYRFIKDDNFKIYKAKMYDPEKPEEIFSFFPCSLSTFERPIMDLPYIHLPKRGVCYLHQLHSKLDSRIVWNDVADQIKKNNLYLGISAVEPHR